MKTRRWLLLSALLAIGLLIGAHALFATGPATHQSSANAGSIPSGAAPASYSPGTDTDCLVCTDNPDNCNQLCASGVGNCVHATHCCRCMVP